MGNCVRPVYSVLPKIPKNLAGCSVLPSAYADDSEVSYGCSSLPSVNAEDSDVSYGCSRRRPMPRIPTSRTIARGVSLCRRFRRLVRLLEALVYAEDSEISYACSSLLSDALRPMRRHPVRMNAHAYPISTRRRIRCRPLGVGHFVTH